MITLLVLGIWAVVGLQVWRVVENRSYRSQQLNILQEMSRENERAIAALRNNGVCPYCARGGPDPDRDKIRTEQGL